MYTKTKSSTIDTTDNSPMFFTISAMAKRSNIGEGTLRSLVDGGQIEHLRIGNKKLLTTDAMIDWYNRAKIPVSV